LNIKPNYTTGYFDDKASYTNIYYNQSYLYRVCHHHNFSEHCPFIGYFVKIEPVYIDYKRKEISFTDILAKIGALFSTFNFFFSFINKFYSLNFDNYKIIQNIFGNDHSNITYIPLNKEIKMKPNQYVLSNDEGVENPSLIDSVESVSSQVYVAFYDKAYRPFLDEHVQAYLVLAVPHYKDIISYQTNILLWANVFMVYCVTGLIVYLVPLFIFRRGRMTFGKAMYGIGLVDSNCLSPSIGRTLARFSIFYFTILILSLFTFGLPIILSFSLMAFSKNKQGFADYMLRINEVDAKRTKIYFSFQEVELEKTSPYKKPIDFKTRNYD
jgi:hypothetical protein